MAVPTLTIAVLTKNEAHRIEACLASAAFADQVLVVDSGSTDSTVALCHQSGADVLITVDNGIASMEGVAQAQALGLQVFVTDHHLPAATLPTAEVIVNPNQPGCEFESKSLAGVGVMFYVLLALRAALRQRGIFTAESQPKLDALLPLVALGTVADVVKLDNNNRRLVAQGLKRIRAGSMPAGMLALFKAAGREAKMATTFDFGFALGPRINAAGRLSDMTLGIECLITDDAARADELARQLDAINRERRDIEGDMRQQAMEIAESLFDDSDEPPPAICVFDPDFHEGVVGICQLIFANRFNGYSECRDQCVNFRDQYRSAATETHHLGFYHRCCANTDLIGRC